MLGVKYEFPVKLTFHKFLRQFKGRKWQVEAILTSAVWAGRKLGRDASPEHIPNGMFSLSKVPDHRRCWDDDWRAVLPFGCAFRLRPRFLVQGIVFINSWSL